jgi:hypothetical protein
VAAVADPKKQLEWEARQRPRAGVAAAVATLTTIVGIWANLRFGDDQPKVSGLEALQRGVAPGKVNDLPSLQIPRMQYFVDHQAAALGIGVIGLISSIAAAWALGFLGVATRARRPELRKWIVYLPIIGGVLSGLYTLLSVVGELVHDHQVLNGARTVADAAHVNGFVIFAEVLGIFSVLSAAGGYVLVSLNAMRVGLLTRMLGWLGIAIGVFFVLPIVPLSPVLQILFQASLALMFFNFWMGAIPPAWVSGQAEMTEPVRRGPARPAPEPATEPAAPGPAPSSTRRKRKKR